MTPASSPLDYRAPKKVSAVVYQAALENRAAAASFRRQGCLVASVGGERRIFEEDLC